MVEAAIDKFKNPKGKKTPYQRKYKKTYNATWEVSKQSLIQVCNREVKRMILRCLSVSRGKSRLAVHHKKVKEVISKIFSMRRISIFDI